MKKLTQLSITAVIAILFTSCEKDYTCTCTFITGMGVTQDVTTTTLHKKKKDADATCHSMEGDIIEFVNVNGTSTPTYKGSYSCHL